MAMRLPRRVRLALRALVRRSTVERELDDELRFHLEQMAQHAADRGADADDAYRDARRRFGGMNQVKEACRDMRTLRPIEHLFQDLRFGSRLLARSPVFTLVAVLSLALGIGANSAIFSVINAVVLRKLPVESPDELLLATGLLSRRVESAFLLSRRRRPPGGVARTGRGLRAELGAAGAGRGDGRLRARAARVQPAAAVLRRMLRRASAAAPARTAARSRRRRRLCPPRRGGDQRQLLVPPVRPVAGRRGQRSRRQRDAAHDRGRDRPGILRYHDRIAYVRTCGRRS